MQAVRPVASVDFWSEMLNLRTVWPLIRRRKGWFTAKRERCPATASRASRSWPCASWIFLRRPPIPMLRNRPRMAPVHLRSRRLTLRAMRPKSLSWTTPMASETAIRMSLNIRSRSMFEQTRTGLFWELREFKRTIPAAYSTFKEFKI